MRSEQDPASDGRSAMAVAMELASRITSISLALVIPVVGGHFCDQWLQTRVLFLLLGLAFGMLVAGLQLMKLVSSLQEQQNDP